MEHEALSEHESAVAWMRKADELNVENLRLSTELVSALAAAASAAAIVRQLVDALEGAVHNLRRIEALVGQGDVVFDHGAPGQLAIRDGDAALRAAHEWLDRAAARATAHGLEEAT